MRITESKAIHDSFCNTPKDIILAKYLPDCLKDVDFDQSTIPRLAKNRKITDFLGNTLPTLPTYHQFHLSDSTIEFPVEKNSVQLILTSPPYWNLKKYNDNERQLGNIGDYNLFLSELDKVWKSCFEALVPGGRLICVVGDVCLSRRKNNGRHTVVPLHASIQEHCRDIGFDNLAPIIWSKISNASLESSRGSSFLGKPYEPNSVIKNDIEFILMQRKPGGYRSPSYLERIFSIIPDRNHKKWFNQIWSGITGALTRNHPAPFPVALAERLIRMFSFVGDTVLDPFHGSGTTAIAACLSGRNSISMEVDRDYFNMAVSRFDRELPRLTTNYDIQISR